MNRAVLQGVQGIVAVLLGLGLGCGSPAPRHHVLFGGDTGFGESYGSSREMLEQKGYDHPFRELRSLLRSAELIVTNLETPITDVEESPHEGALTWLHKADVVLGPGTLDKYGIRALALGNNHMMDYGSAGLAQTLEVAASRGFDVFGAGLDQERARKPLEREIEIDGRTVRLAVFSCFKYVSRWDASFGFYARTSRPGVNRLSRETLKDISRYRQQNPDALLIAFPHWGSNYEWKNEVQTRWAYRLIDAGADIVMGHGSHMLQEVERYNGHWILYGLGNFVFNSPGRYAKFDAPPYSLAAGLVWEPSDEGLSARIRLYPILSDNKLTEYRPRMLDDREFAEVVALLRERNAGTWRFDEDLRPGRNRLGPYLELDL